ncbi:TetR/AcrR family transcriptional regulator [Arthrobacter russicus]|uniref:TetR/AcrR family transcriptional regulator n=1 Tax=Arthrobacter russicus TaxID=172040 RepID=UPI003CF9B094
MPRPGDRRPLIADHAIAVLARGGPRALTHQAVDRDTGLTGGSTSYYFRTREALVSAAVERIRFHSRAAFDAAPLPDPLTTGTASEFIADQLLALTTERRSQALAVIALLPEVAARSEDRPDLLSCLFSRQLAGELAKALGCAPDSQTGLAEELVDFLTGRLISALFLPDVGGRDLRMETQRSVERLLRASLG